MRIAALVLVATALLPGSGPVAAQEPPTCLGQGAEAPKWYSEPPGPPAGVYQAAARSGGCEDAQTAQKVAARLASWLLLHERSRQALVEETLRRRRQTEAGGDRTLSQTARVVERSTLRKVLERSRVYRQATRWTETGKAEHFLILRADTAALREVAAGELTGLAEAGQGSLPEDARPSNSELSWVTLPDKKPSVDRSRRPAKQSTPIQLHRVVLSWSTDPAALTDSVSLLDRTKAARVGVSLLAPESLGLLAVGAEVRRREDLTLPISGPTSDLQLRGAHLWAAYGLAALPGQAVPVYAGYRHRSFDVVPTGSGRGTVERDERALVLGLGVPPFTELEPTGIQNAYLEAAVWPKFLSLAGGGRVTLARIPGGRLHGLLEVGLAFRHLGDDALLGSEAVFRNGEVYLDQARIRTGLELELGGTLGVFGFWQAREATPKVLPDRDRDQYAVLTEFSQPLGPKMEEDRFRVGLRLSF